MMNWVCLMVVVLVLVCGAAVADWSVMDAGAKGDGVFDNTAVFQKALDGAAKAGGGVVTVPAGRYAIRGNLAIPAGVTLQGTYRSWPLAFTAEYSKLPGTVLLAYAGRGSNDGAPFIKLAGSSATVMGLLAANDTRNDSLQHGIAYLLKTQRRDGSWDARVVHALMHNAT